jgi:medium-chain acyl-[acyl-carrier-protein] hydrolase
MSELLSNSWIIEPEKQAAIRLFCFPYAGGQASLFRTWSHELPPQVAVYRIQLPGRGLRFREALFTDLVSLIETLTPAIRPFLRSPFAFFGHSLGALTSFELICSLRKHYSLVPDYLFVSGCPAPPIRNAPSIHHLPDAEFIEVLRKMNGIPRVA